MQNVKHVFFFVPFFHFFYSYIHDSISLMRMQFRKINKFAAFLAFFTLCFALSPLQAESRKGNLDLFVLMDRSLSMVEEFSDLQDYVDNELIDGLLIRGDSVTLMAFFGETQHVFSGIVGEKITQEELKNIVDTLAPDRHYTDIGSALDELKKTVVNTTGKGLPDYVLLLTDGIHEGPPGSPYPGKTEEFDHPLRRSARIIRHDGWNTEVLPFPFLEKAGRLASDVVTAWNSRN